MTIKPAAPPRPLPPSLPPPSPQSAELSEVITPLIWCLLGIVGFLVLAGFFIPMLVTTREPGALLCSLLTLIWAIFLTVWIKKIKDRQTEAVLVQTKSLQALQGILNEIKKQNV